MLRSRVLALATVLLTGSAAAAALLAGCGEAAGPTPAPAGPNPFLQPISAGKADTAYQNPDGVEVEVDLEGEVSAPSYRLPEAPAVLGQFALTDLRKREIMYLESLAEDSTSEERVEWQVDGSWITA